MYWLKLLFDGASMAYDMWQKGDEEKRKEVEANAVAAVALLLGVRDQTAVEHADRTANTIRIIEEELMRQRITAVVDKVNEAK